MTTADVWRPTAVAGGLPVFGHALDMKYFAEWGSFSAPYKQHNAALKFFRDREEIAADPFSSPPLHFDAHDPTAVAVIDHAKKGMEWGWKDETRLWSWHEMIAQMTEESREKVVNGSQGHSGGVVGCLFAVRPNSYDQARSHM